MLECSACLTGQNCRFAVDYGTLLPRMLSGFARFRGKTLQEKRGAQVKTGHYSPFKGIYARINPLFRSSLVVLPCILIVFWNL